MKNKKLLKLVALSLVGISALTSCFGKTISREQAIQILDQIIASRNTTYFLGPSIVLNTKKTELQGLDVLETNEEYHVIQSEGLGRSFVYYATTKFLGEELIYSETYWAFNRNGQFNEIIKKRTLVENLETEDPNDFTYEDINECNYLEGVYESANKFWGLYGVYHLKAEEIVKSIDKPEELKNRINSIASLEQQNYKISDRYTTTGNRSLSSTFEVKRATTGNDIIIYTIAFTYQDATLTSFNYKDQTTNTGMDFTFKTTSSLLVPSACEVPLTH